MLNEPKSKSKNKRILIQWF